LGSTSLSLGVLQSKTPKRCGIKPDFANEREYAVPVPVALLLSSELVPKLIDYALKRMVRKLCLRWNKLLEKAV
jgi:hypothetical protein